MYGDATKVQANTDVDALLPRFSYEAKTHIAEVFGGNDATDPKAEADPPTVANDLPAATRPVRPARPSARRKR